jgi:chemotaxis response regulator CheB
VAARGGEATAGRGAARLTGKVDPEAIVMAVAMPRLNGLEATPNVSW